MTILLCESVYLLKPKILNKKYIEVKPVAYI